MSPNRQHRTQVAAKSQAIREELASLHERAWRYRRGEQFYIEFAPTPVDDPAITSRLFGPDMKSVQWRRE